MFFTMDEVALIDGLIATYFVADSVSESVRVRYYETHQHLQDNRTDYVDLIEIEDGVHIAGDCRLLCHKKELAEYKQGMTYGMMPYKYGKIHLCKNCAIGTGCIVMPGVTVGEGAVVGAGAMVTKDIPAWTLALGCPAKVVKEFPKDDPKYVSKKSQ